MFGNSAILLVRLSATGDIAMALPLVHALRDLYPQAHTAWLVQLESSALLADHPELDGAIVWPRGGWRRLWRERRLIDLFKAIRAFRAELRRHQFSNLIDLQGLLESGLLGWLSGAGRCGRILGGVAIHK